MCNSATVSRPPKLDCRVQSVLKHRIKHPSPPSIHADTSSFNHLDRDHALLEAPLSDA